MFTLSLGDFFDNQADPQWRADAWQVIAECGRCGMARGYLRNALITDDGIVYRRRGGNFLDESAVAAIRDRLVAGRGLRGIAADLGIAQNSVKRQRSILLAEGVDLRCGCGAPAGHKGWCAVRLAASEARQEFIKRWARWKSPALVRPSSLGRRVVLAYPYLGNGTARSDDILEAVNAIVPHTLPEHIRADVCQEMIVDIFVGNLALDRAAAEVRRYISRCYGDSYRLVSLDAPIRGTEDLRLADTIASDRFHF